MAAMTGAFEAVRDSGVLDDDSLIRLWVVLLAYDARWRDDAKCCWVLAVEKTFDAPILGRNHHPLAGVCLGGKIDVLIRRAGEVWLVEHKFTSSDLSPGSTYWQKLRMDPQVSTYFSGARALGHEVVGCIYDVIARPDMKRHLATPPDKRRYTKDGKLYATQREEDETLEDYGVRLHAAIADDPIRYLQRSDVIRLPEEMAAAAADMRATAIEIRESRKHGRAPRNPDACHRFGAPCAFFDVCCGAAMLDDESKFELLDNVHPELKEVTK
jgi:hypothetical protein